MDKFPVVFTHVKSDVFYCQIQNIALSYPFIVIDPIFLYVRGIASTSEVDSDSYKEQYSHNNCGELRKARVYLHASEY